VKVQYADEVVVVKNFRPMKAGNRLEGKTERTRLYINGAQTDQKSVCDAKDGRDLRVYQKEYHQKMKVLKEGCKA
jgi:hypothetical protein